MRPKGGMFLTSKFYKKKANKSLPGAIEFHESMQMQIILLH